MRGPLDTLLRPRSVAVIGASASPKKMGHIVLKNLRSGSFAVHPVNPKEKRILGLRCYASISEIPGRVDLAVVVLPSAASVGAVRECVRKNVGTVIVTSSGFRESGNEGTKLEMELKKAVKGSKTRLLGPNTMGVFVPKIGLDTLFIPTSRSPRPKPGSIAMLSQSGAVSISFLEKAARSGIGVRACVGLGNKADIDEDDVIRQLIAEDGTRCIALYLESFSHGREFIDIVRGCVAEHPVAVLKAGRTVSGAAAAQSHTGALASSSNRLVDCALKQAGAIRVYDEEELMDVSKALAYVDHLRGDRICVVASAGGYGVIATDCLESEENGEGLKMASLSRETRRRLSLLMPEFSAVGNPVDLTAGVTDDMYDGVLEIIQGDPRVDGIMMSLELQPPNVTKRLIRIAERRAASGKVPIVVCAFGGDYEANMLREFERKGIPAYPTIRRAVRALGALARRGRYLKRIE